MALVACVVLVACAAPTLPLPPPGAPVVEATDTPDVVRLVSVRGAQPDAVVLVVNENTSLPRATRVAATLADEAGSWSLEVAARPGDRLDVSQEYEGVRSSGTSVRVPTAR